MATIRDAFRRRFADSLPWLSLGAVLGMALATPATAQERVDSAIGGGEGGSYFEFVCPSGQLLVGLHGSAGMLVDAVRAVCARVDAAGAITEAAPAGPVFGGPRPFDKAAECPNRYAIRALTIWQSEKYPYVGAIRITCHEVARVVDGGRTSVELRGTGNLIDHDPNGIWVGGKRGYQEDSSCPDSLYAIGIRGRSSEYLDAIGLVCGPKVTAAVATEFSGLVGQQVSLQASNYLDRYVRHRNALGFTEPVTDALARNDATFKIVQGLAGRCVSLESHNYPGHFLRHHFWRIKLSPREDSDLFRNDATFCMVPGLAGSTGLSLESASNPGHFIRHRNNELWVDRFDGSDLFRRDATFNLTHPGGAVLVR